MADFVPGELIIPGLADFVLGCKRGTWQPVVQLIETSVWLSVLMRRDIAPTYHTATHNRHHLQLRRSSKSLIRIIDFGKYNFFLSLKPSGHVSEDIPPDHKDSGSGLPVQ